MSEATKRKSKDLRFCWLWNSLRCSGAHFKRGDRPEIHAAKIESGV